MLLDNSVFEEPFEHLQLSKNDVGAFEQLPNGSSSNDNNMYQTFMQITNETFRAKDQRFTV